MKIERVMPKSTIFGETPTTYFWLEADADEAVDVLARVKISGDAMRYFLGRIEDVRKFQNAPKDPEDDLDLMQDTVGFLISADGKQVIATDEHYPISNMWNGYNPFRFIQPYFLGSLDDFAWVSHNISRQNPAYADRFDFSKIPDRVNLKSLIGRSMESLVIGIPQTEDQAMTATDDLLAMAIFLNIKTLEQHKSFGSVFKPDNDLAHRLGEQFKARGEIEWQGYAQRYPFGFEFFKATDVPLIEIFERRARAEYNCLAVLEGLPEDDSAAFDRLHTRFESYSDDEFSEMFLYHWYFEFRNHVTKAFINTLHNRLNGFRTQPYFGAADLVDEPVQISASNVSPSYASGVAENPFLGPDFEDLAITLAQLFDDAKDREFCIMQTYGHKYSLSANSSPYVQAMWNKDSLYVELSANLICNPPLDEKQMKELEFMGWNPPSDGIPNFVRTYDKPDVYKVADFVLTSLVSIYGIRSDDLFAFGSQQATALVDQLDLLDRLKIGPNNPAGTIFCIKGKHNELL